MCCGGSGIGQNVNDFAGMEHELGDVVWYLQRSRAREGSFERDGYNFWDMYGEPKHKRDQKANAKKSES